MKYGEIIDYVGELLNDYSDDGMRVPPSFILDSLGMYREGYIKEKYKETYKIDKNFYSEITVNVNPLNSLGVQSILPPNQNFFFQSKVPSLIDIEDNIIYEPIASTKVYSLNTSNTKISIEKFNVLYQIGDVPSFIMVTPSAKKDYVMFYSTILMSSVRLWLLLQRPSDLLSDAYSGITLDSEYPSPNELIVEWIKHFFETDLKIKGIFELDLKNDGVIDEPNQKR